MGYVELYIRISLCSIMILENVRMAKIQSMYLSFLTSLSTVLVGYYCSLLQTVARQVRMIGQLSRLGLGCWDSCSG